MTSRVALLTLSFALNACGSGGGSSTYHDGDPAMQGGSPTIRRSFTPAVDNPYTSNDESNDQPVGHFGTVTVTVSSYESGNTYTLDADFDGSSISRIYFPKGGWVDFPYCEVELDLTGDCDDEEGRSWSFDGTTSRPPSHWTEESSETEEGE